MDDDLGKPRRQASLFRSGKDSNSKLSYQASELITGRAVPVTKPVRPDHLTLLQNSDALNEASFLQSNGSTAEAPTARTRAGYGHQAAYRESPFGIGEALTSAFTATINQTISIGAEKGERSGDKKDAAIQLKNRSIFHHRYQTSLDGAIKDDSRFKDHSAALEIGKNQSYVAVLDGQYEQSSSVVASPRKQADAWSSKRPSGLPSKVFRSRQQSKYGSGTASEQASTIV